MAVAPKRPIVYRFVFGKGQVKRRQESADTARAVVEQVTIAFAEQSWDQAKRELRTAIETDVRIELIHLAGQFRRNVIGAPYNQRGLVGSLTTKARGGTPPVERLGSLPRWAPRTARYLRRKFKHAGQDDWFDNTGWTPDGGTLREFFASSSIATTGGSTMNIGSGGVFEDMFGDIRVQINRNNRGWGVNQGTLKVGKDGRTAQLQVGTIYVRALGSVTENMLRVSDSPNQALLEVVAREDPDVALHLRGGRGRYRPTLEPYLKFFLKRSIEQAVTQRIARGTSLGRLFKTSSRA